MFYYFIVNPNAGSGRGLKVWNALERILKRRHVRYGVYITAAAGDARKKSHELTETAEIDGHPVQTEGLCIVVVGGDGTMNEVVDGVNFQSHVTLSLLPCGSGNDLSRGLGISKRPGKQLLKILDGGKTDVLDYGVVSSAENGCIRRFMVSSGIGFDAAVCHDLLDFRMQNGYSASPLAAFSYYANGVKEFLFARPVKGWILLDDERKVEFNSILFVSAHILPYEGGGFRFAPKADPRDGKLEVCVVSNRNKLKLVQPLLHAHGKALKEEAGIHFFSCRELHIHTELPMAVHADGESCRYQTDIDVRCVSGQLRFLR